VFTSSIASVCQNFVDVNESFTIDSCVEDIRVDFKSDYVLILID